MTPADLAALHALCFTNPPPWSKPAFAQMQADPLCFVLTEAEGFAIGRAVAGEAELLTLAVAPQARGRGVGTRLVQRFLYQAAVRGADRAFLEVAADNAAALALYARLRFGPVGRRAGYYRGPGLVPVDALLLARPVGAAQS